ncbi:ABC transporter substrate-binding protein [Flavobacterium sp.]|uniref:ABC transporter substrate-binding protein n=1 Tax=Flavobacterium sp. TaxID=239 RepID=UPI0026334773|nr:ABC transporter substrate-binding protein [Flavobacterium sp.]
MAQDVGNTIVLGQTAPSVGPQAGIVRNFNEGAKAYFAKVNKLGGIYGRKIELISINDNDHPELASKNVEELISKQKVFALFGNGLGANAYEVRQRYTSAGIPNFAPLSGADDLRFPLDRFAFNIKAGYKDEAVKLVDMLYTTQAQSVAVVMTGHPEQKNALHHLQRALSRKSFKPAKVFLIDGDNTSQAIINDKPDAIVLLAPAAISTPLIKKLRSAQMNAQLWIPSFVGPSELSAELGSDSRGVGFSYVVPYPFTYNTPVSLELANELRDNTSFSALEGYIAAKVFCEGLRRVGAKLSRQNFVKVLEAGAFDAGGYTVRFAFNDHEGSKFVDTGVMTRATKMLH